VTEAEGADPDRTDPGGIDRRTHGRDAGDSEREGHTVDGRV
jgi:hypothetical protein